VAWVLFFSLFKNFVLCVSFFYHFLLLPGEGGVVLLLIFLIICKFLVFFFSFSKVERVPRKLLITTHLN